MPSTHVQIILYNTYSPDTALCCYHVSSPWLPGNRDRHLPAHFPSSGSCREEWGCLSASFCPDWTTQMSSTSHGICPLALLTAFLPSSGGFQASKQPFYVGKAITVYNIQLNSKFSIGETAPMLNLGGMKIRYCIFLCFSGIHLLINSLQVNKKR